MILNRKYHLINNRASLNTSASNSNLTGDPNESLFGSYLNSQSQIFSNNLNYRLSKYITIISGYSVNDIKQENYFPLKSDSHINQNILNIGTKLTPLNGWNIDITYFAKGTKRLSKASGYQSSIKKIITIVFFYT